MILGVELREESVLAVVTDATAAVIARARRDGSDASAATEVVRAVLGGASASVVGIAVPDPLDEGVRATAAAIASAAGLPEPRRLVRRGPAIALGEYWAGAAQGASHVVALIASDHVHAGLVVNGLPFDGAHGVAGAASWLSLNPVEREDYRRIGCLEAEIGRAGIVRRLVWRIKSGDPSRVLEMAGGDMGAITVQQIFDAARAGDSVSISVVRDTVRYIGMAVANLVAITDPDVVVLGGLIAEAADQLLQPSHTEARRRLPRTIPESFTVVAATLGDDAGPLGAARAAMLGQ